MVFLLDSSSTIGKDNFRKLEDFLKDVVQDLNISPDGVHVGLMQYSSYPSLEFPLDMHTSRYDVLKAIDNVSVRMQLALTLFAYAADLDRNMCIDASVILLNRAV